MAHKQRQFNVFSLSFLDIMSCGFGAVILIFIVINHSTEVTSQELSVELLAEVRKLEKEVLDGSENLVELKTTLRQTNDEILSTEEMIILVIDEIRRLQSEIADLLDSGAASSQEIEALKIELRRLEEEAANLQGSVAGIQDSGSASRAFVGQGDRQYLTGIRIGGERILILLDASASMLHRSIVDAIRLSIMSEEQKLASSKWQRAVRTVEWIAANMPADSALQLVTFNTETNRVPPAAWIDGTDKASVDQMLAELGAVIPNGGTSLYQPFAMIRDMEPRPDNIFLIIDSLPTQGERPSKRTVIKSVDRVRLYADAIDELPSGIPVNVILFPMEGDPLATPYYWILAQQTAGSFLTPSRDWP